MLEEFIDTGKIEKLEEMRPQPKANPDQVEWFATLTEEQAGYIQDYWDQEGEKKCAEENCAFGSRGIPFTFEYEGDTYKVDGDAKDHEWKGRVEGVTFEGTIYKNGVEHGTFSMTYEVAITRIIKSCCIGEDKEDDWELAEACRDAFMEACIFPDNMQYREYDAGDSSKAKFLVDMFGDMTEHECEAMYDYWGESGRHTYEAETDEDTT